MSDKDEIEITLSEQERKRTLLIADSEPFIRDTLRIKFAGKGFNVLLAATGRDTVRTAAHNVPGAILMEIDFSDVDGYKICQMLKGNQRTEKIPIVVLTKLEDNPERKFLYNPYVVEFLRKPFSPREIVRIVGKILRGQN